MNSAQARVFVPAFLTAACNSRSSEYSAETESVEPGRLTTSRERSVETFGNLRCLSFTSGRRGAGIERILPQYAIVSGPACDQFAIHLFEQRQSVFSTRVE